MRGGTEPNRFPFATKWRKWERRKTPFDPTRRSCRIHLAWTSPKIGIIIPFLKHVFFYRNFPFLCVAFLPCLRPSSTVFWSLPQSSGLSSLGRSLRPTLQSAAASWTFERHPSSQECGTFETESVQIRRQIIRQITCSTAVYIRSFKPHTSCNVRHLLSRSQTFQLATPGCL